MASHLHPTLFESTETWNIGSMVISETTCIVVEAVIMRNDENFKRARLLALLSPQIKKIRPAAEPTQLSNSNESEPPCDVVTTASEVVYLVSPAAHLQGNDALAFCVTPRSRTQAWQRSFIEKSEGK